jgi:hypothetical protein
MVSLHLYKEFVPPHNEEYDRKEPEAQPKFFVSCVPLCAWYAGRERALTLRAPRGGVE